MATFTWRTPVALTATALLALSITSCAESKRDEAGGGSSGKDGDGGGTFVFASSSDPVMLDPAFASDGETFRVSRQMFEGLVGVKEGTADPAPLLATKWEASEDGKTYTFTLREGVKFHDGTDFNAEAVCKNFDRWYNWKGLNQSSNITYYYSSLFKGFANNESDTLGDPLYSKCEAASPTSAVITLTRPFAAFPAALSLPAFAMQSPTAMEKHNADNTEGDADDPRFSEYATKYAAGTGPFQLDSWDRGQKLTLKRFDDYWGDKAKLDKVILQPIADGKARLQALKGGDVDGFDMVAPGDIEGLKSDGYNVMSREPFTILYMAMNQKNPALAKPKVRQAIAHAIDKQAVANQTLPTGTKLANQFMPDTVKGTATDAPEYAYDVEKAKTLLKEAGEEDLELNFFYPTGVSRPYMPSPEDTFVALETQLKAAGIKVKGTPLKWSPDYLDAVQGESNQDVHLLGWTGDYNSADNFVGVFFGKKTDSWGFDNPELFTALENARQLANADEQTAAYQKINKQIMEFLPGVPLAHPVPSIALDKKVKGYKTSPIGIEIWNTVSLDG